jgi:hypothetical protein
VFSVGIDLWFSTPQKVFEDRVAQWYPSCTPRPGAIPREMTVELTTNAKAFSFDVKTSPSNALVESCLRESGTREFQSELGVGVWNLHVTKKIAVQPHVRVDHYALEAYGKDAATDCNPTPEPNAITKITMTAKPDDREFRITATGSPDFSTCVSEKLNKRFAAQYRVVYMDGDQQNELFRIDGDVNLTVNIKMESATERTKRLEEEERRREMDRQRMGF